MMVIFRLFMNVNLGFTLWIAMVISVLFSSYYLLTKSFMITRDTYALMAIASCVSLSIIAGHFLWIAIGVDLMNMIYFLMAMVVFAICITISVQFKRSKKKKKNRKQFDLIKFLRIIGWSFFGFLFFYQLVLSYLLRPNFLTVMALAISHFNLLLIIWTYFDIGRLYSSKTQSVVVK